MIRIGIVGLPNVGKSSLFKLLTKVNVIIENYPFATINPNIGIVSVPDERLKFLQKIYNAKKIISCKIEFYDIAGLIKGASKGEGLGNKFLSHIQETDAICHVVRFFDNKNITHVHKNSDIIYDFEVINLELAFHDIKIIENAIYKLKKKFKNSIKKEIEQEIILLNNILKHLNNGKLLFNLKLIDNDKKILKKYNLLTFKPMIVLMNLSENQLLTIKNNNKFEKFIEYLTILNIPYTYLAIKWESECLSLTNEERMIFFNEYKIENYLYQEFIRKCFSLLNQKTFFTCGKNEIHAWNYVNNENIKSAVKVIHNDFSNKFISAKVIAFKNLLTYQDELIIKNKGLIKTVSKKYLVNDGDIVNIIIDK